MKDLRIRSHFDRAKKARIWTCFTDGLTTDRSISEVNEVQHQPVVGWLMDPRWSFPSNLQGSNHILRRWLYKPLWHPPQPPSQEIGQEPQGNHMPLRHAFKMNDIIKYSISNRFCAKNTTVFCFRPTSGSATSPHRNPPHRLTPAERT